eukprot:CAMPEP_0169197686 /NCGR_PEP_ID=MMETSP1016-20121227/8410_1 /TAXON_ID=342587 /ORGANISM="Karlodinium micrum, Strain CCMP2283" /LENGTH=98 /DNA_ID=CAMNT_0009274369 /DNA_START=185 /DNA_END=478 /DNA_ORIENTATION=-
MRSTAPWLGCLVGTSEISSTSISVPKCSRKTGKSFKSSALESNISPLLGGSESGAAPSLSWPLFLLDFSSVFFDLRAPPGCLRILLCQSTSPTRRIPS